MKLYLTLLFGAALFVGCQQMNPCGISKASFLNNYEEFVEEVGDKEYGRKDKAWETFDERFEKYTEECYPKWEDDLTNKEKSEFGTNTVRYVYSRYGQSFFRDIDTEDELREELEDLGEKIGEFAEELGDELTEAFEEFADQIDREKLNKTMDDISKFFEDLELNIETDDKNQE